jgi:hypothetical protein
MPGLTLTAAFTSLLPMPTLAPTPTFGLALVPLDAPEAPAPEPLWVLDDWLLDAPCVMLDVEPMSVDC